MQTMHLVTDKGESLRLSAVFNRLKALGHSDELIRQTIRDIAARYIKQQPR